MGKSMKNFKCNNYNTILKDHASPIIAGILQFMQHKFSFSPPATFRWFLKQEVAPVQKRITFLNFSASSVQNVIFCEILWLTLRKKLHVRNRLNFYLQQKPDLTGNYVAL